MQKTFEFLQGLQVVEVRSESDLDLVKRIANLFDCPYRQTFLGFTFERMKSLIDFNAEIKHTARNTDKSICVEYHPSKGFTFGTRSDYTKAVSEQYFDGILSCRVIEKELETLKALINKN